MDKDMGKSEKGFLLGILFYESEKGWDFKTVLENNGVPDEIVMAQLRSCLKKAEKSYDNS